MSEIVTIDRVELLKAIRYDCVTFLAFYIQDELELEVPEFHIEIWEEFLKILEKVNSPEFIVGQLRKLFCVPRGHAKSTLSKLAVVLFLRYSKLSFALYASNTRSNGIAACQEIKAWFDSPQDRALYGNRPEAITSNKSEALWKFEIPTPQFGLKTVYLKAAGADSAVRGMLVDSRRPQIVVVDDCEDLDTANTKETQLALDEWLLGSLLKAVARQSVVIMLGNMIKKTTLIARLSTDPKWNPTVFGSIVRDKVTRELKPLWPGIHSIHSLMEDYKDYRRIGRGHVWAAEMMNLTSESVFGIELDKAVMIPMPNPDQITSGCIVLDPAFGEKGWNDESAITVHVQLKDGLYGAGLPHVVQTWRGRVNEDQLLDNLIGFAQYWGIGTWCIEAVAAQRLFIPLFRNMMIIRGLNPDAVTMIPITGGKEAKHSRILAYRNSVTMGSYGICESCDDLLEKLINYDPTSKEHDDLIDSASLGMVSWADAGKIIEANGIAQIAMTLFGVSDNARGMDELEYAPM